MTDWVMCVNTKKVCITSPNWLASSTFQIRGGDDGQTLEANTELSVWEKHCRFEDVGAHFSLQWHAETC